MPSFSGAAGLMGAIGTGVPAAREPTSSRSSRLSFSSLARRSMISAALPLAGVLGVEATGVGLGAAGVGLGAGVAGLSMAGTDLGVDLFTTAGLLDTTTFGVGAAFAGAAAASRPPGRREATSHSVGAARMSSMVITPSPYTSSS